MDDMRIKETSLYFMQAILSPSSAVRVPRSESIVCFRLKMHSVLHEQC